MKPKVNGFQQVDKQDHMTLLDSTDSDTEWLSLPPIKGKRTKRKKSSKIHQDDSATCSSWTCIKVFLAISLVGGVIVLSISAVWLTAEINDLRNQIKLFQIANLDPHTRVNVDFKPSKRMKKRRELDALVGGGKSRRKNSTSGHELLRSNGSESSDDDFRISPHQIRGSGICSTCTSILVFLLLVACLLVCAGLAWMHVEMKNDLETLRTGLHAAETRGINNLDDIQRLLQQMTLVNRTLARQSQTLDQAITNISTINLTVVQLSGNMDKLSAGIAAAPELKTLPDKITAVSNSLANLGSDVSGMKDTVAKVEPFITSTNTKLDDLTKKIQTASETPVSPTGTPNTGVSPELSNMMQGITKQIEDMNSTMSVQMSLLMQSNTKHEERLSQLEDTTKILSNNVSSLTSDHSTISSEHSAMSGDVSGQMANVDSEQFRTAVKKIVTDVVEVNSSGQIEVLRKNITDIAENLRLLEDKYTSQATNTDSTSDGDMDGSNYVTQSMFNTMGVGFQTQIQDLNHTMVNLKSDVYTLSGKIVKQSNTVVNLTHHVDALSQYIVILQQSLAKQGPLMTPRPVTVVEGTTQETSVLSGEDEPAQPDENPSTEKVVTPTSTTGSEAKVTAESPKGSTTQSVTKRISVSWIKTPKDFDVNFRRWDRGGTGQVKYESLDGYLGPETPQKAALDEFDTDHNGMYSEQELANAFGFILTTESPVTEKPPR